MYCIHIYKNALCCTQLLIGVVWGLAMLNWNPTKLNLTCYTLTYFACQISVSNAKMRSNVVSNQQCHLSVGSGSRIRHLTLLTHLLKQWHQSNRPPGETSSSSTVILIITSFSFRDKLYYCFFCKSATVALVNGYWSICQHFQTFGMERSLSEGLWPCECLWTWYAWDSWNIVKVKVFIGVFCFSK